MTQTQSGPGLRDEDVALVLAGQGFGEGRLPSGAVILALLEPLRVVWANRAAVRLFGSDQADELFAQVFSGRGREGLGASVKRLPPDGVPRLERLCLIRGFRSRTLALLVSRSRLQDGRPVIVLTTPSPVEPEDTADAFSTSALRAPLEPVPSETVQDVPAPGVPAREEPAEPAPSAAIVPPPEIEAPAPRDAAVDLADHAGVKEGAGSDAALAEARLRLAGQRATRLLWQTDAHHDLVALAGGIPTLAGVGDALVLREPLARLLVSNPEADRTALDAALAAEASWSGLRLRWPLADLAVGVAVTLGAVPLRERDGSFAGFRGFGILDLGDLEAVSPPASVADAVAMPSTNEEAAPPSTMREEPRAETLTNPPIPPDIAPLVAAPPAPPPLAPTPPAPVVPDRSFSQTSKVVVLRPYQTFSAGGGPLPPRLRDQDRFEPPQAEDVPVREASEPRTVEAPDSIDLTSSEKSNFSAIARALLGDDEVDDEGPGTAPHPYRAAEGNAAGVLEALGAAILIVGPDRFHYANPGFHALTGYASLDALSEAGGLFHLLGGLEPQTVLGSTEDRAFPLVSGAGGIVAMQGRLQPITWDGGPASLLTMHPATDRIAQVQVMDAEIKRRDIELGELRGVLDRTSDSLVTVDRQGRVLTLNGAAERLFGYGIAQAAGEPLAMLVGADAQIAVNAGDSAAGLGQTGLDVGGRSAAGKSLALRMTWLPLSHGRSCVLLRDQAERFSLKRDLETTKDRLDEALAGKPEFLAKISHEIRTPLNAILGFTEVILDERFGPIGNERYKSYLSDIHASGTEVLGLVNDLLDLSTMEAGRTDMHPTPLDVNRVIGECVAEMQNVAHRERVIMRLSLLPHLAAAHLDERAFRQIMGHILSNAIRFNEPGGQVIVSSAMIEGGAIAVRVRDTGIGMTDAEVATAMEPFRLSRTANPGGNGLGLPLARALIEANGATMSIRSQKNEGTLVEVLLPSAPSERMRVPAE